MLKQGMEDDLSTALFGDSTPEHLPEARFTLAWRIGIVFVAVTLIWLVMHALANMIFGDEYSRSNHSFRAIVTLSLVIPLIVFARRWLDRRPLAGLALESIRQGWRPLLVGLVCWLIPATFGVIVCVTFGWTEISLNQPLSETLLLAMGLIVLVFIYEALPEELIFRGYFYRNLTTAMPRWKAVLVQAILFVVWGLLNGGPNSLDRSLLFFVAGIVLGVFRVVTGSIWASIGFHLAFQTVAQLFGSIGDQFTVTESEALTLVAFGILPFATGITLLNTIYKDRPSWHEHEPDIAQ